MGILIDNYGKLSMSELWRIVDKCGQLGRTEDY